MNTFHPHPWSEFPAECLWYFVPMGVLHLIAFVIGCLVFAALANRQRGKVLKRVGWLGLFLGLLLLVGSVFNGLWSCIVWGRLYFSTDYVFDFSPFWPITQSAIDAPFGDMRGQLFGVSLFRLQLAWLVFAAGTWAVTILLYRLICRRPPANKCAAATRRERSPLDGSDTSTTTLPSTGVVPAVAELGLFGVSTWLCQYHRK